MKKRKEFLLILIILIIILFCSFKFILTNNKTDLQKKLYVYQKIKNKIPELIKNNKSITEFQNKLLEKNDISEEEWEIFLDKIEKDKNILKKIFTELKSK